MININALMNAKSTKVTIVKIGDSIDGAFVKNLRKKLNVSQSVFATIMNVSKKTIEAWEEGRNPVKGGAAVAMFLLNNHIGLSRDLIRMDLPEDEKSSLFPFARNVKYYQCDFCNEDSKYREDYLTTKYVITGKKNINNESSTERTGANT